ncbi:hypothetical protein [Psychroflexus sediminis]|uniref:Uncharacterized protein n=1 Tax=Psychroflexus sediminis TaxID=470826 RepID=A0A1G7ZKR9_9FLAO|nr:hypothetical protein [Psychroflexus sediminis]SDH09249.1 hypothetical protein SAMN04488027_1361 [Psychroflexus sediminis]
MKSFKSIKIIFSIFFIVNLVSCASHKKINRQISKVFCSEEFYFALDKSSELVKIKYQGEHWGKTKYPDYQSTFRDAIEELKSNSKIKMEYKHVLGFPSDKIIKVNVIIKSIEWEFKETSATMRTELLYEMPNDTIYITGVNKVIIGGSKTGNLMKSLKDGTYKFLTDFCTN